VACALVCLWLCVPRLSSVYAAGGVGGGKKAWWTDRAATLRRAGAWLHRAVQDNARFRAHVTLVRTQSCARARVRQPVSGGQRAPQQLGVRARARVCLRVCVRVLYRMRIGGSGAQDAFSVCMRHFAANRSSAVAGVSCGDVLAVAGHITDVYVFLTVRVALAAGAVGESGCGHQLVALVQAAGIKPVAIPAGTRVPHVNSGVIAGGPDDAPPAAAAAARVDEGVSLEDRARAGAEVAAYVAAVGDDWDVVWHSEAPPYAAAFRKSGMFFVLCVCVCVCVCM
jgi:hypothetical protein